MDKVNVSIILLNYNGKNFNIPCIDSILKQNYQDFEIVFVDNASVDGSLEEVKKTYKKEIDSNKIIIVENTKNTGFTGGNNIGVQYANKKSEYICLLNNDTTIPINRLEELIIGIASDKKLGAVGSVVLDKGYEDIIKKIYFKNHEVFVLNILGETAKKKVSNQEIKKGIYYTSSISGCSFLYKKDIVKKPFPDFYFAYGEDVFLSLLLIKEGYKLGICTKSMVYHEGSGSFGKKPSDLKLFYGNRNQIINYLINYNLVTKIKLFPLFCITQIAHIFINAPQKRFKAKVKARIWIIKNYGKVKKIRDVVNNKRIINDKGLLKILSYKFSDNLYRMGGGEKIKKIINIMNNIFDYYIGCFFR